MTTESTVNTTKTAFGDVQNLERIPNALELISETDMPITRLLLAGVNGHRNTGALADHVNNFGTGGFIDRRMVDRVVRRVNELFVDEGVTPAPFEKKDYGESWPSTSTTHLALFASFYPEFLMETHAAALDVLALSVGIEPVAEGVVIPVDMLDIINRRGQSIANHRSQSPRSTEIDDQVAIQRYRDPRLTEVTITRVDGATRTLLV